MALVDDRGVQTSGSSEQFDRQPPQDFTAEQSVLGGMLLSKDAIADVVEVLRATDFYRPGHQAVYDCVLDLYGRGEPADPVTVASELERRGELGRAGGAPYLHTLMATVPTAANAGYYAEIVAEKAVLRRLVEAGTRIVQLGYHGSEGSEVDEVVDRAQAAVYEVTERRMSEDYVALEDLLQPTLDEIDAIASRGGQSSGVPTGFADLDSVTNGLHAGQMCIVAARPGIGKALALDTPLPTPDGWTTMGDVTVGDQLLGRDGRPTTVLAATEVMHGRPCYEVEFCDGTVLVADAQHEWPTEESGARRTRELVTGHTLQSSRNKWTIADVRVAPRVPVRCAQVDNDEHLYLAGNSMIPTHNSTLGLDFARACSVGNGQASVIFSLEMSRTEITMRLLSAESKIRLADMRSGRMSDDDWTRLARRMGEVSEAPLFIDDSPNMTMMEIRAKARRLKQRNDLRLIVVDYMQLMTSGKKVESRQMEVSEFSRQLKLLAKELDVPVVTISQLNRGPEQRTDKKPMLADLRESGCLTAGTRILRADTGAEVTLGELLASAERNVPVWSLDERMRLVARPLTHAFPSGTKQVFRLTLRSGKSVEATTNHRFLTLDGWKRLDELEPGSRLAVPRSIPEPLETRSWPEQQVILLAHLIGDGSFVRRQPIRYASIDEANLQAVTDAGRAFGSTAVRDNHAAARCISLRLPSPHPLTHGTRNPIAAWLDELGLFGLRSHEKFIPDAVFALPREQIALFLRHFWATDGCVYIKKDDAVGISYSSTSRALIEGIQHLLLRFGINSRLTKASKGEAYRLGWILTVCGHDNQVAFIEEIGVHGARGRKALGAHKHLNSMRRTGRFDTVPASIWNRVAEIMKDRSMGLRELQDVIGSSGSGDLRAENSPSRRRLARMAATLDDAYLNAAATGHVFWDEVKQIASLGEHPVFDATVLGTHNFVANGISVHNSLEQDADLVMLIHRPDAWERDDPRAGEADLILAKHRNGPTATITVAHQLHYSRFYDIAQG